MKNGQLKPAYNVQISTMNQVITHFGIYQRPGDTALLIPYLEAFKEHYGLKSLNDHMVVADAGYGSEQNYEYIEKEKITGYVKYNYFHMEQKRKLRNNIFLAQNLLYNPMGDFIVCPVGQRMDFVYKKKNRSDLGYESETSVYKARECEGCPLRSRCHKAQGNRTIELNHKLLEYKRKARELPMNEEGMKHRSKRPVEVEAVFGQLKKNKGFNRFLLRGLKKVEVEFGLLAMAHNLMKLMKNRAKSCFLLFIHKIIGQRRIKKRKSREKTKIPKKKNKKRTDRKFYFSVGLFHWTDIQRKSEPYPTY